MTLAYEPLQVTTLGPSDITEQLDGATTDAGDRLTATERTRDELCETDDFDCLVLDQRHVADWRGTLRRVTERHPAAPVVVLVAADARTDTTAALQAGASSTLPRSLPATDPGTVATHLGTLVEGHTTSRQDPQRSAVEQRFELVTENVDEIIYIASQDFSDVEYVNAAYEEVWGRPVEELYDDAMAFLDGIDPRDREAFEADFESMRADIRQGTPAESYEFEFRVRHPDGEVRWVSATGYPVTTDAGEERYVGIVEDTTERRQREHEYEQIFDGVNDAIAVHDPETGDMVAVNETMCDITGYDKEALLERGAEGVTVSTPEFDPEEVSSVIDRVMAGETVDPYEQAIETATGARKWFEVNPTRAVIDGEEQFLAISRDVTARRERQSQLAAERDRWSVLFENTPDPIMGVEFVDGDPYITEVNPAFEDAFGFEAEAVTDRPIADVIVPADEREAYEEIRRQALAGEPVEAEVRRETDDGRRTFLLRVLPFESGDHRQAYVWYTDITEQRERERAIEEERQKYSTLVEQSTDGVAVVRDGRYVFVNEQFTDITDYAADELFEMPFEAVFTPESRELIRERYERRVAGESPPSQYDVEVETATGDRRTLELAVSRIRHEGEPATMANFRDVTERRERERAVEQLQTATERLQGVDTAQGVYDIAVETAQDVLGLPMTACWQHRKERARLEYVAGTDPVEEMDGGPVSFTPGDTEYEVFEAGDATTYDPSDYHAHNPLDRCIVAPVGDWGLLAAGERGQDAYEPYLVDVMQVLAGHTASALERVHRAEQLRESERRLGAIVDRIDEAIFLAPASELAESAPAAEFVSSGYEDIWGQPLERIQETHDEAFFSTLHPADHDGYRTFVEGIVTDIERGEARDRYTREYRIQRPDGDTRWVRSEFYPTDWVDDRQRIIVASRDVTARKEREQTLESFHDATAELTTADTAAEASRTAVEAAASVFDLPETAVYRYDDEAGRLNPAATGPELPPTAELAALTAEHEPAWAAFVDERMRRIEDGRDALTDGVPDETALLFPLGGNGLLAVWQPGDSFDTDAASILAATLEAALNRLRGERRLESRRAELEAQTQRARRLESITELTQRVEAAITTESSRDGIQDAVCAELTDVEPFDAAWVLEAEVGTDTLRPRALSGISRDDVEQIQADTDTTDDPTPAAEAWQAGRPAVSNDLVGGRHQGNWRQRLLRRGVGSVCSVPLSYEGLTHGVLTVLAEEPDAFGDREVDVLAQLGTSIGYAITAADRQRALESDDTLELEFRGGETDLPMARLAGRLDCRARHRRTVRRQDGTVSVYYRLEGHLPEELTTPAEAVLPGDVTVVSRRDGVAVIERRGSSWFGSLISEYGGLLRHARGTDDGVRLVVELPSETDTRTIVERIQDEFTGLELYAQRHHRETGATPRELHDRLEQRLSDRQYEALETAQAMGYFQWPRENSGEDVADALGITQPTVNKHIRLGEQTVFDLLFGSHDGPTS